MCEFGNIIEKEHFKQDPLKLVLRYCKLHTAFNQVFRAAKITKDDLLKIPELAKTDRRGSDQVFATTFHKLRRHSLNNRAVPP